MTIEERRARWRAIINGQAASGLNIAAYCRETHVHTSLFYTWRRKFREEPRCSEGFVELKATGSPRIASGVFIRLDEKLAIEVERGFDPVTLRAVVATLSR